MAVAVESYGMLPRFERAVVWCACTSAQFFGSVVLSIDLSRLSDSLARQVLVAALAVSKDRAGRYPGGVLVVQQRLQRWVMEGKLTAEVCAQAVEVLDEEDFAPPDPDAIAREIAPILRRQIEQAAVRASIAAYSARGAGDGADFAKTEKLMREARTVGEMDRSDGDVLDANVLDEFAETPPDKLSTGIVDLDLVLSGGIDRGTLSLFAAGAKAGKSMLLGHVEATALRLGLVVAHATLENSAKLCKARLVANLTNTPITSVLNEPSAPLLQQRWAAALPTIGTYCVKWFPSKVTTVADIVEWVSTIEEKLGRKIDVLGVDYIDKLGATNKALTKEYEVQGLACEELRIECVNRNLYGITASQTKRKDRKDKGTKSDLDDLADSQGKARVADLVVTVSRPTEAEVLLYVAGSRMDEAGLEVGPLPHAFAFGQFVPV